MFTTEKERQDQQHAAGYLMRGTLSRVGPGTPLTVTISVIALPLAREADCLALQFFRHVLAKVASSIEIFKHSVEALAAR